MNFQMNKMNKQYPKYVYRLPQKSVEMKTGARERVFIHFITGENYGQMKTIDDDRHLFH